MKKRSIFCYSVKEHSNSKYIFNENVYFRSMTTYLRKNMFLIQKKDCLICYKRFFTRNTFKKNLKLEIGKKNKELLRNYSQDEI